ncbi:MAG: segregation/condensation protein A [bacterium]|nr:segregation/condensation protein A [bacterium]
MAYQIKLEQFEGPLDILLQMIEKEEMDITKISMAKLADEFIEYLGSQTITSEELADFLSVAARLLFIKSQSLFPNLALEDDDAMPLEAQLRIYKEYWEAAKGVEQILGQKQIAFFRDKIPVEASFRPSPGMTSKKLQDVFEEIIEQSRASVENFRPISFKVISLEERINRLKELVLKKVSLSFNALGETKDKSEKIADFLAVLELIKQQIIKIEQRALFSDIIIEKNNLEKVTN